ncbi:MAG: EAL domain-containing protein [Helicobacteraceae bacterium]|jgi:PAS domain S-box-containing protein|nr:EAL domain-containing protein [Helicobacteraceae bacterium]
MNDAVSTLSELKILFVEDDHGVLDAIAKILGRYVGELYVATNGKEGLHIYSLYKPDIVVTDIKMPVMDGLKMAREIRKLNPDAPIVIVSAFNEAEYVTDAIELGVFHYLFKPLELEQLLNVLDKCAQHLFLKREIEQKTAELNASLKVLLDYKSAIDASAIVSKTDADNVIVEMNDAFCDAFGYAREELIGANYGVIRHPFESEETVKAIADAIANKKAFKGVVRNKSKNGESLYFNLTIAPILDPNGKTLEYIDLRQDITPIINRRYIDDLTDLPNRNALELDLLNATRPALILLNLDGFSEINDACGSKIGDKVLIEVARALGEYLVSSPSEAKLYKLSADEYGVLAFDQSKCGGVRSFAESLLEYLESRSFGARDFDAHISAKAGYTISKSDALSKANMALRVAKRKHISAVCAEDLADVKRELVQNLEWIAKIKKAINANNVTPFFQPVVDLKTGAIVQYECLMRIMEDGAAIKPPEFLSIARKTKQYGRLSQIMIEKSCEYFSDKPYDFSLNINMDDVCSREFKKRLKTELEKTGAARRLVLELSQRERIDSYPDAAEFIKEFKALGCKITLDDYGVGYSSSKNLISLKPDFIKLDGSIASVIDANRDNLIFCEAIAAFADKLGVRVIAKHAHSETIGELANRVGVGYAQGYFYSEPIEKIESK